jgi:hypothetical protein
MATIRLPVHPLYGERVEVIARYGRHALRVEQPDGLRLLPVAWTDLVPRPAALAVRGRPIRLAPEALRELGAWVAARVSRCGSPEKVAAVDGDAPKLNQHGNARAFGGQANGQPHSRWREPRRPEVQ